MSTGPSPLARVSAKARSLHSWLLLAVLGLAPALPSGAQGTKEGIAAIVNDKVITFSDVRKQVKATEELLRESYAGVELVEKVKEARLKTLKSLIERDLIIQEFDENVGFVPDDFVEQRMKDIINSDYNGDRTAFIKTLLANGISLESFRSEIRDNIVVQYMRQANVQNAVIVSPFKIEQYYQDNVEQFVQPQQVKLRLIYVKKALFPEERTLPDGSVEEYDPQKELLREILYKLDTGSDFAELARNYSEGNNRDKGGDFGWVQQDMLRPDLRDTAFELKPGQHSRIIETEDGYYVVKVEDIQRRQMEPMAEVRSKIERKLIQEERRQLMDDWIDGLRANAFIKMF
ncbi:MAG: peptidylprolyl isomerase [Verrucomicrobiota bacterium]